MYKYIVPSKIRFKSSQVIFNFFAPSYLEAFNVVVLSADNLCNSLTQIGPNKTLGLVWIENRHAEGIPDRIL